MTTETKTKKKTWKYHTSHKYTRVETGRKFTFQTQLYKIGVYGIVNNNLRYNSTSRHRTL